MTFSFLELDPKSGAQTVKNQDYALIFDDVNRQFLQIEYQRSIDSVDYGAFGADIQEYSYISDFEVFSLFLTKDFMYQYFNYFDALERGLFIIKFSLSRTDILNKIVYEKFASPLAQFLSILNTLMSVGILALMISEAKVFESMIQVYLRVFYRQTAADLLVKSKEDEKS